MSEHGAPGTLEGRGAELAVRSVRQPSHDPTHPGETRVLVHVDVAGSSGLPIELKPVAYDAELLAEVRRRLGEGVVDLTLA